MPPPRHRAQSSWATPATLAAVLVFVLASARLGSLTASIPSTRMRHALALAAARPASNHPPTAPPRLHTSPAFAGARAHAAPARFDEALMNKWGLHRPGCTPGLDFLVANTGMSARWVCWAYTELGVVVTMRRILEAECAKNADDGANLVLDVGSNSGFYGLMATALGCPTLFFDIQPGCNKIVTGALLANGWADRGLVVAAGLSKTSGTVRVASNGTCDITSGQFPLSARKSGATDWGDVAVPTEPLSTFIGPDTRILLMKIDTEGFEQRVLAGCMPYFERRLVKHAVVEVTPGHEFWEAWGVRPADVADTLERIVRAGYSVTLLPDVFAVEAGNVTTMTDPRQVRDWVLSRGVGQIDVLLSLV